MNKRLFASILILLLVLTAAVVSYTAMQRRFNALSEALHSAMYANAPAQADLLRIERETDRSEWLLKLMLDRRDLSQLLVQIHELPQLAADPEDFREACIHAIELLRETKHKQSVSWTNIL